MPHLFHSRKTNATTIFTKPEIYFIDFATVTAIMCGMTPLHTYMISKRLKLREVSAATGISIPQLCKIKKGQKRPSPEHAEILSKLTKIAPWEFIKPGAQ